MWFKEIVNGFYNKFREDIFGDRGNIGVFYILFGEIKVILNNGDKRSSSKSGNEVSEE